MTLIFLISIIKSKKLITSGSAELFAGLIQNNEGIANSPMHPSLNDLRFKTLFFLKRDVAKMRNVFAAIDNGY